ncbi:MAG: 2-oxoglutarate dehydrogenase E1 component [Phycisphaerales bacterium]|nr:MAG: 2-oxoglutarate dehydrogenase E1 component [Phycisphaerales bacterium]
MSSAPKPVTPSVNGWNAAYLDAMYAQWRQDPGSVAADMAMFFSGFDLARANGAAAPGIASAPGTGTPGSPGASGSPAQAHDAGGPGGGPLFIAPVGLTGGLWADSLKGSKQAAVASLMFHYRDIGHLCADLDPFGRERDFPRELDPQTHGLRDTDLDTVFDAGPLPVGKPAPLRDIIEALDDTYCRSVGAEYMHIADTEERCWLAERMERSRNSIELSRGERFHVLWQLLRAESFEKFLHTRYPGEKRFSLEGSESLIPLLDRLVECAARDDVEEIVIGMAHRGRLNVLNNIIGKTNEQIFTEFEDNWEEDFVDGGGDVKYHRGYSGEYVSAEGKKVWLAMNSNPSHLESVNPVVCGRARAKQRARRDEERRKVIPLLIHGDAAVIAQGMVAETLNLSQLDGYATGGTVHVVVNNLIGFTTGPDDARSTRYCTDLAKMIDAPILHVNGEDPEACVHVAQIAFEYRQRFRKDVFIDMWCYRRWGHNESDEPSFTQPVMYDYIKRKPSVLKTYAERLLAEGVIDDADMDRVRKELDEALDQAQAASKVKPYDPTIDPGSRKWQGFGRAYTHTPVQTGVPQERLQEVANAMGRVPEGFNLNRKLKNLLAARAVSVDDLDAEIDYATAESLAYGTLLTEGVPVRLSGQDCRRGTFSHRHAALRDAKTAELYVPLNHIRPEVVPYVDRDAEWPEDETERQAAFEVWDSPLSEQACVGFEYGFNLVEPRQLVLWEAQFGDFANGAQVIFDQYLASAEIKWQRWNGLTLLLPHGYEGAGPEHSSARMERFLQLCGDDNMQVVHPSTAAQMFHLLRRQVHRPFRKPLIVMTPKSMLRVPTSQVRELVEGRFHEVIDDPALAGANDKALAKVRRVVLCSGKVYHELAARRDEISREDVAIVRVEQLYPLHTDRLAEVLARYPADAERCWAQEEPQNMGAFRFIEAEMRERLGVSLRYIGRVVSATPAVGSKTKHKEQQEAIIASAIGVLPASEGGSPSDARAEGVITADSADPQTRDGNHKKKDAPPGKGGSRTDAAVAG